MKYIPVILGPTASGKTMLAVALAAKLNGEIISADSRQVYRDMNIGTGKDYTEYIIDNQEINCHLIDILDAGEKYDVARFKQDCFLKIEEIQAKNKMPIICGGTGLYVEAVLRNFTNFEIPPNEELRNELETKTTEELRSILNALSPNHSIDISTRKRIIRGIEVFSEGDCQLSIINNQSANGLKPEIKNNKPRTINQEPKTRNSKPATNFKVFCLNPSVELRREKITQRLQQRLDNEGLIEEVEGLLQREITPEQLIYYGLEYKFITEYLQGKFTKTELFERLNSAIHRFAKRQMTFFRSMEKRGTEIQWLHGDLSTEERLSIIREQLLSFRK